MILISSLQVSLVVKPDLEMLTLIRAASILDTGGEINAFSFFLLTEQD